MAEITLEGGTYTSAIENATELIVTGNVTITDWTGITKVTVKNGATVTTDYWNSDISLTVDLEGDTRTTNNSTAIINYTGIGAINYGLVNIENGNLAGGYVFDGDLYVNNKVYYAVSSADTTTLTTVTEGETTTTYIDVNGATFATTATDGETASFNSAVNTQIIKTSNDSLMYSLSASVGSTGKLVFVNGSFAIPASDPYKNMFSWGGGNVVVSGSTFSGALHLTKTAVTNAEYLLDDMYISDAVSMLYSPTSTGNFKLSVVNGSYLGALYFIRSGGTFNNVDININDSDIGNIGGREGAPNLKINGDLNITATGSTLRGYVFASNFCQAGNDQYVRGDINITLTDTTVAGIVSGMYYAQGGNAYSHLKNLNQKHSGKLNITVSGGSVANIYGSSIRKLGTKETGGIIDSYTIAQGVFINVGNGATVGKIYANQDADILAGGANVTLSGATVATLIGNNCNGFTVTTTTISVDEETGETITNTTTETKYAEVAGGVNLTINAAGAGQTNYAGSLSKFDTITINAGAALKVGTFTHSGSISVDASNMTELIYTIVDADTASPDAYKNVTVTGNDSYSQFNDGEDLFVYNAADKSQSVVYKVDREYDFGTSVYDGVYYGINAFTSIDAALQKKSDDGKVILFVSEDTVIDSWEGIDGVLILNGAKVTTGSWKEGLSVTVDLAGDTRATNNSAPVIDYTGTGSIDYGFVNVINGTVAGGYVVNKDLYVNNYIYYSKTPEQGYITPVNGAPGEVWVDVNGATFSAIAAGDKFDVNKNAYIIDNPTGGTKSHMSWTLSQSVGDVHGKLVFAGGSYNFSGSEGTSFKWTGNIVANGATFTGGNIHWYGATNESQSPAIIFDGVTHSASYLIYTNPAKDINYYFYNSDIGAIQTQRSTFTFKADLNIYAENSVIKSIAGGGGGSFNVDHNVNIQIEGGTIGSINLAMTGASATDESVDGNFTVTLNNVTGTEGALVTGLYSDDHDKSQTIGKKLTITVNGGSYDKIYGSGNRRNITTYTIGEGVFINVGNGAKIGTIYANQDADIISGGANVTLSGATVNTLVGNNSAGWTVEGETVYATITGGVNLTVNAAGAGETNYAGSLSAFDTITINAGAALKVGTFTHSGKITFDASQVTGDIHVIVDADTASENAYANVTVNGLAEGYERIANGEDLFVYNAADKVQSVVYKVDREYDFGASVSDGVYYGVNAFASIDAALQKKSDDGKVILVISEDTVIDSWEGIDGILILNGAKVTTESWKEGLSVTVDLAGDTRATNNSAPVIDYTGTGSIDYGFINVINGDVAGGYLYDGDLYVNNKVYYAVNSSDTTTLITDQNGNTFIDVNGATFATTATDGETDSFNSAVNTQIIGSTSKLMYSLSSGVGSTGKLVFINGEYNLSSFTGNPFQWNGGNVVVSGSTFNRGDLHLSQSITGFAAPAEINCLLDGFNRDLNIAILFKNQVAGDVNIDINKSKFANLLFYRSNGSYGKNLNINIKKSVLTGGVGCNSGVYEIKIEKDLNITISETSVNGSISVSNYKMPADAKKQYVKGDINITLTGSMVTNFISGMYYHGTDDTTAYTNAVESVHGGKLNIEINGGSVGAIYGSGVRTLKTTVASTYTIGQGVFINVGNGATVGKIYANQDADILAGGANVTLSGATVTTLIGNNSAGWTVEGETRYATITGGVNLTVNAAGEGKSNYVGALSKFDTITINAGAALIAGTFTDVDAIIINSSEISDFRKVLDAADTTTYEDGMITLNGESTGYFVSNGDIFVYSKAANSQSDVYFDSSYSADTAIGKQVGKNAYFGVNAFNSLEAAQNALSAEGTLNILSALNGGTYGFEDVEIGSNLFGASADGNVESVDLSISGATTQAVLGGGSSSGSKVTGTIDLDLTNSNVGTVYGGGYSSETGKITLNISGSTCNKMVYGGNVTNTGSLTADTESTIGDVDLTINGGEFKDKVVGGSRVVASENSPANVTTKVGNVTLNIDGGHFTDSIFGAGYILGNKNDDGNESNALLKVAGVTMTLNGAEVADIAGKNADGIYAGGLAARGANIYVGTAQTRNAGSSAVNITVNSGKYTSIYGGGWAESGATVTVYGVSINVTGGEITNLYGGGNNDQSGARTYVDGDVLITISGGTIGNVCAGAKFVTSKVKGSSTVRINGEAEIGNLCGLSNNNYDGVLYDQTLDVNEELKCDSISGFDIIDIAAKIEVEGNVDMFGKGIVNIDLAGFAAEPGAEWTVLSAAELNNLEAVTFGTAEVVSDEVNKWRCGDYTLTFNDNDEGDTLVLKYTKLA